MIRRRQYGKLKNCMELSSALYVHKRHESFVSGSENILPTQAQVIICGAGVVGNSVAYHLIENGWMDVLLIDKGSLCGGTSHFSSGTLGLFKPIVERNIIMNSIKLYRQLQAKGYNIGLKQCGSLNLAQTKDRMISLKRTIAYNLPTGLHCELVDHVTLKNLHPFLNTNDIEGGVWVPEDSVANSQSICKVLAKLAIERGAQYIENCEVQQVLTENKRIKGVQTNRGYINCEYFVNCGGMWARELGQLCMPKVRVPVNPAEHFYVTSSPLSGVNNNLPFVRDYDSFIYIRELNGAFLIGAFEAEAKPAFLEHQTIPSNWKFNLPTDWDHFSPFWKKAMARIPILKQVINPILTNSPDTFTPDGKWIVGETPEGYVKSIVYINKPQTITDLKAGIRGVIQDIKPDIYEWILKNFNKHITFATLPRKIIYRILFSIYKPKVNNYFVAVGMNGNPLQGAGGIGRAVAEWIIQGEPTQDLLPFNVDRFLDLHNNRQYLQQRTKEVVGRHYAIVYHLQSEYKYARKLRCSPLYSILEKSGAVFGTRMGYERPLYFVTSQTGTSARMPSGTFAKPKFLEYMMEEYYGCREGVGIIDMSSLSKIRITKGRTIPYFCEEGKSNCVVDWMQRLCSRNVNISIGGIVYTGMQNERGGYENDCILVRETASRYLMISPTSQQTKSYQWMCHHLPQDGSIALCDVTSMYSVINVVGPKAVHLLSELSQTPIQVQPFTCRDMNIGYASDVMMLPFTDTGEQGFSLYIPSEYTIHVYDRIMTVGQDYGVKNVGSITQRFMRIEKFIPLWAEDLTSYTTPFESGNNHRVNLDKEYFIGKSALQRQKDEGVMKRLVQFTLEDLNPEMDVWAWGTEPIFRNNKFVGSVTSVGYGFTLKKLVCMGFISKPGYHHRDENMSYEHHDLIITDDFITDPSAKYEIDVSGRRVAAKPYIYPIPQVTSNSNYEAKPYIPKVTNQTIPCVNPR